MPYRIWIRLEGTKRYWVVWSITMEDSISSNDREHAADAAPDKPKDQGLIQEHTSHFPLLGSDAPEDPDLLDPFGNRHQHDIQDGDPGDNE